MAPPSDSGIDGWVTRTRQAMMVDEMSTEVPDTISRKVEAGYMGIQREEKNLAQDN
jgi:hypothetical protein